MDTRLATRDVIERIAKRFNLKYEDWMQDWAIQVPSSEDCALLIDGYEAALPDAEKSVMMSLILASYDECISRANRRNSETESRLLRILEGDWTLHRGLMVYWGCFDISEDEAFRITPFIRNAWRQCEGDFPIIPPDPD